MNGRALSLILIAFTLLISIVTLDYYNLLDIAKDSTESDIKRAFRKLSISLHPDKNPGDQEAANKFVNINKAYEVLSNIETRQIYDLYGEEGLKQHAEGRTQMDPWGRGQQQNKGPNAHADISVTLADLYNGAKKEFNINRNILCPQCRGTGSKDGKLKVCKHCNGQGHKLQNVNMGIGFNVQMQVPCDRCGGKGKISSGNCPRCSGHKVVHDVKTLEIIVEKGMQDGQQIVFEKESEQSPDYVPGDVVFTLKMLQHPYFKRIGNTLYMDQKITLQEAILGFNKDVKHLDNHYTRVESIDVTQPFSVKVLKQEGMPIQNFASDKGDMHVKMIVHLPQLINDNQKDVLKKIFSLNSKI